MADHASHSAPDVPAELIARHRDGWHSFTHATVLACASVAAVLLFLLLVFKIL